MPERQPSPAMLAALDDVPTPIILVGRDGVVRHWNHACAAIAPRTLADARGSPLADLTATAADAAALALALARASEGPSRAVWEWTAGKVSRRLAWTFGLDASRELIVASGADLSVDLIAPDDAARWCAFVRDERRAEDLERERLLREAEADRRWLRAVLETVPVGVLLFEPSGRLVSNRRAEVIFGTRLSSTGGSAQYAPRLLYPDGRPVPREEMVSSRVLRTGEQVIAAEFLVQHDDGTRIPILGSAAPMRADDGSVVGAIGVFQDVSERMRAEEAVRANERMLDSVFDLLPVGVWVADRTGTITRTNPAGLRIWAGARYVGPSEFDQYVGWWADTDERIAPDEWAIARALHHGETSIGELIRIRCFDGTHKTIINSAMPLLDAQGQFAGAVVVNEDVTALREVEDALRRAVLARDEVLGFVAHDLRSPLNAIVMQAQLIASAPGEERVRSALDVIKRQTRRMARMIDDLLDLARLDAGALVVEKSAVDVPSMIDEVVEPRRPLAARISTTISVSVAADARELHCDRERLSRALDNLLGNALKFSGLQGRISIDVCRRDDLAVFAVSDTGPGISPEERSRVFDRFWTRRPADRRGVGLGLAIVKGIVEAHGGEVWVTSELGAGATFRFTVPALAPTPEVAPAPS